MVRGLRDALGRLHYPGEVYRRLDYLVYERRG
jgi:hypothetical protein